MKYSPINIVFILDNGDTANSDGSENIYYKGKDHELIDVMDGTLCFVADNGQTISIAGIVENIAGTCFKLHAQFTYEYDPMKEFIISNLELLSYLNAGKDFFIYEETIYFQQKNLFVVLLDSGEVVTRDTKEDIESYISRLQ